TGRSQREGDAPLPGTIHETAREIDALGGRGIAVACDHADDAQVKALFERVERDGGRLDILVNNAGMIRRCDALAFTEADWDAVIDVNLKSVFFLSQAVARQMVRQGRGGKIVNVASMLSFQGGIRVPSYT
ncbi:SDR family NAD(P)-dependent oxidoreductase, partial [Bacillus licheniformis]|nr:SDR family NAD(P)-dependent oxidoreductase [Bacillus licheniformis]